MSDLAHLCHGLMLYHFESCPFCHKVRRYIETHQLPIAMRDIRKTLSYRDALIEGGGRKQVPCLHISTDGQYTWLYESDDIIAWLEQQRQRV